MYVYISIYTYVYISTLNPKQEVRTADQSSHRASLSTTGARLNHRSETRNPKLKPETPNPKLQPEIRTRNPKLETRTPRPETRNPESEKLNLRWPAISLAGV